jgi:hypothetical protein
LDIASILKARSHQILEPHYCCAFFKRVLALRIRDLGKPKFFKCLSAILWRVSVDNPRNRGVPCIGEIRNDLNSGERDNDTSRIRMYDPCSTMTRMGVFSH